ncbi:hypothetical protein R3P38DRAFT_2787476 [Favolaschia claudopus]|uniref:Uncharacterized protein n=1 Tax=Favolaschia claudopus TaxID=2862362 RepID=A0AAW0AQH8_9AGAR
MYVWDWIGKEEMIDHGALSTPSSTLNSSPSTADEVSVKREGNNEHTRETAVKQEEVAPEPLQDVRFSELSDFEKWVICRMRETVKDGVRLSTRLQNLKKSYSTRVLAIMNPEGWWDILYKEHIARSKITAPHLLVSTVKITKSARFVTTRDL